MYSGSSAPAWGHFRLPHQVKPKTSHFINITLSISLSLSCITCFWIVLVQLMPPSISVAPSSGSQMDFPGQPRTRSVYTAPSQQLTPG